MCGRIFSRLDIAAVQKLIQAIGSRRQTTRRGYNIGPMTRHSVVTHSANFPQETEEYMQEEAQERQELVQVPMLWGLGRFKRRTPSKNIVINIRVETLTQKFKGMANNRAILFVEGYFEWKEGVPYCIKPKQDSVFCLACLYDEKEFGIITTPASDSMCWLHDRMPALLKLDDVKDWVSPEVPIDKALRLLQVVNQEDLECFQVGNLVNSIKNDSADVILPLAEYRTKQRSSGIMKFCKPIEKRKEDECQPTKKSKLMEERPSKILAKFPETPTENANDATNSDADP